MTKTGSVIATFKRGYSFARALWMPLRGNGAWAREVEPLESRQN